MDGDEDCPPAPIPEGALWRELAITNKKGLHARASAKFARVEPGIVLDDLRAQAERHTLTFGPDPATHAQCTLGGMIGNNSCGVHSIMSGKTVDNIDQVLKIALQPGQPAVTPAQIEAAATHGAVVPPPAH